MSVMRRSVRLATAGACRDRMVVRNPCRTRTPPGASPLVRACWCSVLKTAGG